MEAPEGNLFNIVAITAHRMRLVMRFHGRLSAVIVPDCSAGIVTGVAHRARRTVQPCSRRAKTVSRTRIFLPAPDTTKARRSGPKSLNLAEREGFEPSIRRRRIPDFESGAFDHSATSPDSCSTGLISGAVLGSSLGLARPGGCILATAGLHFPTDLGGQTAPPAEGRGLYAAASFHTRLSSVSQPTRQGPVLRPSPAGRKKNSPDS